MHTSADRGNAAMDFLLFAALGLTLEDFEGGDAYDKTVDAAIGKAYTDASRHVLSVEDANEKKNCKDNASREIKSALGKLADSSNIDFDSWHRTGAYLLFRLLQGWKELHCRHRPEMGEHDNQVPAYRQ